MSGKSLIIVKGICVAFHAYLLVLFVPLLPFFVNFLVCSYIHRTHACIFCDRIMWHFQAQTQGDSLPCPCVTIGWMVIECIWIGWVIDCVCLCVSSFFFSMYLLSFYWFVILNIYIVVYRICKCFLIIICSAQCKCLE